MVIVTVGTLLVILGTNNVSHTMSISIKENPTSSFHWYLVEDTKNKEILNK